MESYFEIKTNYVKSGGSYENEDYMIEGGNKGIDLAIGNSEKSQSIDDIYISWGQIYK